MRVAALLLTVLIVTVLTALMAVPGLSAQGITREQVLARMDANAKAFKSLDATIERTLKEDLADNPTIDSGKLYVQTTKTSPRIKLELTEPQKAAKFALIENGTIQVYERTPNTLMSRKVKNEDQLLMLLMGFGVSSDKIQKSYEIGSPTQETVDGEPVSVIELTAREQTTQFRKIRLWLSQKDWTPVRTELTQRNRDTATITYKAKKLNAGVSNSVFKLDLPKVVNKI